MPVTGLRFFTVYGPWGRPDMAAFIFALVFGLSDEWHQSFVPGRMADGWDLLADAAGALLGAAGYCWRYGARAVPGPTFPR